MTGVKFLLISGLGLGFRLDDWLGGDVDYYQDLRPQLGTRQDIQDGRLSRLILPAFIVTFIASSITNLLFPRAPRFPRAPLFPLIPGKKQGDKFVQSNS